MIKNDYHVYDKQPKPWYKVLYVQVLIAIALGVRISRVVYSLFDKSTFEVSHKELSCSTTYGV